MSYFKGTKCEGEVLTIRCTESGGTWRSTDSRDVVILLHEGYRRIGAAMKDLPVGAQAIFRVNNGDLELHKILGFSAIEAISLSPSVIQSQPHDDQILPVQARLVR